LKEKELFCGIEERRRLFNDMLRSPTTKEEDDILANSRLR